ncbi:ABC transporter ATP-binding protein [Pseudoroseicyclus aestuarii]|uniref:ATP-binding cassette subfamily B multidrug efflux pump n=1 Tax=Pseudoroseicyclus aestuarii TaxID=1795041 RepID=A0A318SVG2_9RHOB|nr:ABC transporter ATP-binding protein [Pseudoroseicyclus aestuarii]PYE84349.1 ATP-binding cassette subfamily B multidrug efflux pump [Pseudoroseicyclus aestuarii]
MLGRVRRAARGPVARWIEDQVDPFAPYEAATPPRTATGFVRTHLAPLRRILILASLAGLGVAVLELALIWYGGRLVDLMAAGPDSFWAENGMELVGAALLLLVLRPLVVALNAMILFSGISTNLLAQTLWRAHRHLLGQPVVFFQNDFAGRLSNRVMQVGAAVEDGVFLCFEAFWQGAVFAIVTLIVLIGFSPWLALPLACWIVLYIAFVLWFAPQAGEASERFSNAKSRVTGRIVDSYANIESVKLFAHAEREEGFARSAIARLHLRFARLMRLFAAQQGALAVFNSAALLFVVGPALWLWSDGRLSVGEVAAAVAMALRLNTMTGWLMWMTVRYFEHLGTIREGLQSLAVPQTVTDAPGAAPLALTRGEIRYEDVSHHYGRGSGGLDHVSLTIRPGERIGLVGPSGAGKSSLVGLLLRFRDVEAGRVTIDGQDVGAVRQDSLRARIGMVTQDSSLMHRSVRDNLLYGRPDATEAQMIEAAKRAEAYDFILGLEDGQGRRGFDAHVGERGVKLSGGQRQRIALARVILKDAPILILDEATSALDSEVEAAIQETLYRMMVGKTVIAIAHRLSTIAQMDRIVVMEAGRIVEQGTHEALLAEEGLYARFWARQSGGFLGAAEDTPEQEPTA